MAAHESRTPRTMLDKIWDRHAILAMHGRTLLYADLNLVHEGSRHAFAAIEREGLAVRRPDRTAAFADHYVPTADRPRIADATAAEIVALLAGNARRHGILHLGMDDPRQGIVHVAAPELGLSLPGMLLVCADSHVATHGALGALTKPIGASELRHVLATQTVWQSKPGAMRIVVDGALAPGVGAKDLALHLIARIGANGATGHAVEYAGAAVRALAMDGRFALCNMSIEMGAAAGFVAPDDTTLGYIDGRPFAPRSEAWDRAVMDGRRLPTDDGAGFDRALALSAADVAPTVTWGTSPEDAAPIDGRVPDPATIADAARRARVERAMSYMGLAPGTPLAGIPVDRVFIGSCTNARIDDLRAAAAVVDGRKSVVPAWVVPGSKAVKDQAEAEGLDRIFKTAGMEWRDPGCSMCVGVNGDLTAAGQRCAATSNRNFEGRQGSGARTHLMSPAMAAAAAVIGRIGDVRRLVRGRA
ncbi:MAG: 3-isopropylmalate dehydratase large subunit [Alphaproteobacteria bacterium]|nr:3-isopropylmalate dehydratase large subunit [Alphaproteobacteria bacterium]